MANPFDTLTTSEGSVNLPNSSGETTQLTSKVQNFSIAGVKQTANEVLLKLNSIGITDQFKSFSESVTNIQPGMPQCVPGYLGGQFPDYVGTGFNPTNINQTLGVMSVPSINGRKVFQTTEAQQLKELRSQLTGFASNAEASKSYRVKLTSMTDLDTMTTASDNVIYKKREVVFDVRPTFADSRAAQYTTVDVIHGPGAMQIYKNTDARTFQLAGKFVSNTSKEASKNLEYINIIRSWVMPFYGEGTEKGLYGKKYFGAPPEVLWFDAYGEQHFKRIPVVMVSYNFSYDEQYDMIPSLTYAEDKTIIPMPIIMAFTIDLKESYSPSELGKFDLEAYRTGNLTKAYGMKG